MYSPDEIRAIAAELNLDAAEVGPLMEAQEAIYRAIAQLAEGRHDAALTTLTEAYQVLPGCHTCDMLARRGVWAAPPIGPALTIDDMPE